MTTAPTPSASSDAPSRESLAGTPCSGSSRKAEKQKKWYEKMKADPVRYAAFQAKYNSAANERYHANKHDTAWRERKREWDKKTSRKMWDKIKADPQAIEKKRARDRKQSQELDGHYVMRTIRQTTGLPKQEIPESMVEFKIEWLKLCRKLGTKYRTI